MSTGRLLGRWLVWGLLLLVGSSSCTCEQTWQPPGGASSCDPKSPEYKDLRDARLLSTQLSKASKGILSCLQLAWGTSAPTHTQTTLVRLRADGALIDASGTNAASISLPPGAKGQAFRFRLFVFSPGWGGDPAATCHDTMSQSNYDCLSDTEAGVCLAALLFTPASGDGLGTFPTAGGGTSCQLSLRRVFVEGPAPEPEPDEPALSDELIEPPALDGGDAAPRNEADDATEPMSGEKGPKDAWLLVAGGKGADDILDIAEDKEGNIYIAGAIYTASFQPTTLQTGGFGKSDIFLAKLSPQGEWLWARTAGGAGDDAAVTVAIGPKGDIYLGGFYNGSATFGSLQVAGSSVGHPLFFVAKLDKSGTWRWVRTATPNTHKSMATSLAVSDTGAVFVGGFFDSQVQINGLTFSAGARGSLWLARLDQQGRWGWIQGHRSYQRFPSVIETTLFDGPKITLNSKQDRLYITSEFGFGTLGPYKPVTKTDANAFVAAFDLKGDWQWVNLPLSEERNNVHDLALHPSGGVVMVGDFHKEMSFGTIALNPNVRRVSYIAAIDEKGQWRWAKTFSTSPKCRAHSVATDEQGHVYVGGQFEFNCVIGGTTLQSPYGVGLLFAKLDPDKGWLWAIKGGGPYDFAGAAITDHVRVLLFSPMTKQLYMGGRLHDPFIGPLKTTSGLREAQLFVAKNPFPVVP